MMLPEAFQEGGSEKEGFFYSTPLFVPLLPL